MIYLDSSVLLARVFAEDRCPPDYFFQAALQSSRLLEYEVVNRVHALGRGASHMDDAVHMLSRVAMADLSHRVLARAREPFPMRVRTLDALHLATMFYLVDNGQTVELASYDRRLNDAAETLGIELASL